MTLLSSLVTALPEHEIRDLLAEQLDVLEPGLTLVRREFPLSDRPLHTRGKIDILARDRHGLWVIIELKRSTSTSREALHEVAKYAELLQRDKQVAPDALKAAQVWAAPVGASTYQADRAGTLGGQAQVSACGTCPDGKLVGFIGGTTNTGTLTFADVEVATTGTYQLRIDYINGDAGARTGNITVNGGTPTPVDFPNNGSWTVPQARTVTVTLRAGDNTIRFGNPDGWAASVSTVTL